MTHHPTFQGSASSSIQSQATRGIAVAVRRFFHSDTFTAPTMWFSPVKFCSWTMMDLHSGTSWDLMGHTSLNKSHSSARTLCRCLHLPSMKLDQRNILLLRSFPQLVQSCSPHVGVKPRLQRTCFVWPWQMEHHFRPQIVTLSIIDLKSSETAAVDGLNRHHTDVVEDHWKDHCVINLSNRADFLRLSSKLGFSGYQGINMLTQTEIRPLIFPRCPYDDWLWLLWCPETWHLTASFSDCLATSAELQWDPHSTTGYAKINR